MKHVFTFNINIKALGQQNFTHIQIFYTYVLTHPSKHKHTDTHKHTHTHTYTHTHTHTHTYKHTHTHILYSHVLYIHLAQAVFKKKTYIIFTF